MSGRPTDAPGLPLDLGDEAENGGEGGAPFVPQPRGRGRPPGAKGKASLKLSRYAAAQGLRDPGIAMLEFVNADPVELRAWFREHGDEVSLFEVVELQLATADKVHPYMRGKVQADAPPTGDLPVLVVNAGPAGGAAVVQAKAQRFSIIDARPVEEADFRDISGGDPVPSHETSEGDDA